MSLSTCSMPLPCPSALDISVGAVRSGREFFVTVALPFNRLLSLQTLYAMTYMTNWHPSSRLHDDREEVDKKAEGARSLNELAPSAFKLGPLSLSRGQMPPGC